MIIRRQKSLAGKSPALSPAMSIAVALVTTVILPLGSAAQDDRPELPEHLRPIAGATIEAYCEVEGEPLFLYRFQAEDDVAADPKPCVIFYYGGGWNSGTPTQFLQHCRYLTERGIVAIAVDYRVHSRHQSTVADAIIDARNAFDWVIDNAEDLGVDPEKVVVSGGSAGGHLAAWVGVVGSGAQDLEELAWVPKGRPAAMVLFNPVVCMQNVGEQKLLSDSLANGILRRAGAAVSELSPFELIHAGAPPCLIFHGSADGTVEPASVEAFRDRYQAEGNRCELSIFDGQGHGFFNYGRAENEYFLKTVEQFDRFLIEHGFLTGEPSIEAWLKRTTR